MSLNEVELAERLAKIETILGNLSDRLDKNDALTQTIYEVTSTVKLMAEQNQNQNEKIGELIRKIDVLTVKCDDRFREQGRRIGALETVCLDVERHDLGIKSLTGKVDTIEKEPAQKWKALVSQVVAIVVSALIGGVIGFVSKLKG